MHRQHGNMHWLTKTWAAFFVLLALVFCPVLLYSHSINSPISCAHAPMQPLVLERVPHEWDSQVNGSVAWAHTKASAAWNSWHHVCRASFRLREHIAP